MRFDKLDDWLRWQQSLHPHTIELGLERVGVVARRLGVQNPRHKVITVAGTNGKGSCVAMLEAILIDAGYRVGSYTSPHLLHYNERVRVQRQPVTDTALSKAFERIDGARQAVSLSYFEFGTLAAMLIFADIDLDVAIMEVGMGGRLDAVNLLDADLALITSIDLDHTEWLGATRESIGYEKAGIMRAGKPVVCGDPEPPDSIAAHAAAVGARIYQLGVDFSYRREGDSWCWRAASAGYAHLPLPALRGDIQLQNAAAVLMGLSLLSPQLRVDQGGVRNGLRCVSLAGRYQRLAGTPEVILDVAHNPAGARALASTLRAMPAAGRTLAVFAVLADKDAASMVDALERQVDHWYLAANHSERALPIAALRTLLDEKVAARIEAFGGVAQAYRAAREAAAKSDRVVVFGSAFTVAEVLALHV
ncbi:MAG: bifunctional tetrahydrofolate synthase/dihydrofolate synthase [Gammaproteobacteria bacterium]